VSEDESEDLSSSKSVGSLICSTVEYIEEVDTIPPNRKDQNIKVKDVSSYANIPNKNSGLTAIRHSKLQDKIMTIAKTKKILE